MKKKKLLFLGSSVLCMGMAAFTLGTIKNVGVSYAIPTDTNGLPTQNFTTNSNFNNPTKINLVGNALPSSYSNGFKQSFEAVSNLKDSDGNIPLYVLSKNKYTPSTFETFGIGSGANNPIDVTDAGLKRIIKNGYSSSNNPKTVFDNQSFISSYGNVTNENEKQYLTQLAIWLYLYKNESSFSSSYCSNDACKFFDTSNAENPSQISYANVVAALNTAKTTNKKLSYISELLTLAETNESDAAVCNFSSGLVNYDFNDNKNYILSGPFKLTDINDSKFISWSVELIDPNHYGLSIVDNSGNAINNLNNLSRDQIIRVKIPVTSNLADMAEKNFKTSGIKVTVNAFETSGYPIVKDYRVTDTSNGDNILLGVNGTKTERFSDVMLGIVKGKSSETPFYLRNFTIISKVDATDNDKEIPGAHLEIYNGSDMNNDFTASNSGATAIASWVSKENESHRLYLSDGTYGLCETIFPEGYGFNEAGDQTPTCIKLEVNNGTVNVTQMRNYPIPDTGLFSSKISVAIGGGLIIIGIMGMVVVLGNGKKNKKQQEQQQAI